MNRPSILQKNRKQRGQHPQTLGKKEERRSRTGFRSLGSRFLSKRSSPYAGSRASTRTRGRPCHSTGSKARGERGCQSRTVVEREVETYDSVMMMPERLCDRRATVVSFSPLRCRNDKERR